MKRFLFAVCVCFSYGSSHAVIDSSESIDTFIVSASPFLKAKKYETEYAYHYAGRQLMGYFPQISTEFNWQARNCGSSVPHSSYNVNIYQPLIQGFGPLQLYSKAMYSYRSSKDLYKSDEDDVIQDSRLDSIGYTLQYANIDYMLRLKEYLDLKAKKSNTGFTSGLVTFIERDTAVSTAQEQDVRLLVPRRDQESYYQRLCALAGQQVPYVPFYAWDRRAPILDYMVKYETVLSLRERTLKESPMLKSYDERIAQAAYTARAYVWSYLPTLSSFFTVAEHFGSSSQHAAPWQGGLQLSWNFDGWINIEESHLAEIDHCRLMCEKLAVLDQYTSEIALNHKNLKNALELKKAKNEMINAAREQYRKQKAFLDVGLAIEIDVEEARSKLEQLVTEKADLSSQAAQAYEKINNIVGDVLETKNLATLVPAIEALSKAKEDGQVL